MPDGRIWADVVEYGADPTGVADSSTAIQNAINAVPITGGVVFFPRGTYDVGTTLTIPLASGTNLKPVHFVGEGYGYPLSGGATNVAGHASIINWTGTGGTLINALSAYGGTETNLAPNWNGSFTNLRLEDSGSGANGILANALLGFAMHNCSINGFTNNMRVKGEYYYARWTDSLFRNGQMNFNHDGTKTGGGPKANGAVFFRCRFEGGPSTGVFITGQVQWSGQFMKFDHCWFEDNDGPVIIDIQKSSGVIFSNCYFEDQDSVVTTFVKFESLSASHGQITFRDCYCRMTAAGPALLELKPGSSGSVTQVRLDNVKVAAAGSGQHLAIRKSASWPASAVASIVSAGCGVDDPADDVDLFSGALTDLDFVSSRNCMFTEDWATIGVRNYDKPAATTA